MLPFGVTIPATVPQRSEIPEELMSYPVCLKKQISLKLDLIEAFPQQKCLGKSFTILHNEYKFPPFRT
jgi:hypothetical protein